MSETVGKAIVVLPTIRASAIAGMAAAVVWIIALVVEYQYALLRPPGDGSGLYEADQTAFFLAAFGYLVMLTGLFRSRAGGDGRFGRVAIGIWVIAVAAIALALLLGLFGVEAIVLLPIGGLGQLLGSILTAVAVWRARRWTGWRRLAPAIWTTYFFVLAGSIAAAVPFLSTPAVAPTPTSPSELAEAVWQVTWFLLSLALYIESGRHSSPPTFKD